MKKFGPKSARSAPKSTKIGAQGTPPLPPPLPNNPPRLARKMKFDFGEFPYVFP